MVRQIVVLGTASSVPTRHRNHNGYLLVWDDEAVLFDPGEGTQRQLLRSSAHASHIRRICLTHFHGDHVLGLPGMLQRLSIDSISRVVDVFFPAGGIDRFEAALRSSVWARDGLDVRPRPSTPGVLDPGPPLTLSARRLDHSTETLGYRVEEPPVRHLLQERLRALGLSGPRVGDLERRGAVEVDGRTVRMADVSVTQPGNSMAFVMDTRLCDAAFELAADVDLLVCEATFLDDEAGLAAEYGHLTARQAARIAAEAGARRLVLTHFSQRHPDERAFLAQAREVFADVVAARDLLVVELPSRRRPPA